MPDTNWPNGQRVVIKTDIELYPIGIFEAGLAGVVVRRDTDGDGISGPLFHVKLDEDYEALAEWNNELQVWGPSGDCPDCTTENFEALENKA